MNDTVAQDTPARLARLQTYVESDPNNFSLLTETFDCALALGELKVAQQYLSRALLLEPTNVFLRHSQATLWIAEKRYTEAEALLQELVDGGVDASAVIFNLAYVKIRLQKFPEGRDLFSSIKGKPDAPEESTAMLLRCVHHLREFDEAFKVIEQAMQDKTLDVSAAGVASLLYLDANQLEQAKRFSEAVLQKDPSHVEALVACASVALAEKNPTRAKSLLAQALHQNDQDGRVWSANALANLLEMNLDRALQEFKLAVTYMPGHIGTWHGMAWCNLLRKDLAAAQQNFESAMALDRNFGETHGGMAVVHAIQGRRLEAEVSIERALRLDPTSLAARYAQGILSGEATDHKAFMCFAERVLAGRAKPGGGSLADLLREPGGRN
ncbi:MAG TPA: tetratricopeptide repeat protein [Noviherbaspirillum sp.]|nr:tetratricopeptide repeat protein [Noviherbaspirillum sp.]